ncbi:hypothetical protein [Sphingomonas cavernae]|uniref:Uncharacterized protein n=1 Tax=Sphingomonas cavernae TaxID=2320861 RepID=A0A418WQC2_9SPHN|nr:hypothetical protein [Sphingomonas cavernae]RJF93359.1 hypothetical protein D3876_03165 [Sphingomonas cavernae]
MMRAAVLSAFAFLIAAHPAAAKTADKEKPRAEAFQNLLDCKAIAESAQRLACYDAQVSALETAEKQRDVVIVDKQQVREARRGLFGFTLPSLKIFGDGDNDDADQKEEIKEIEATIAGTGRTVGGGWRFTLEDGARWSQIDQKPVAVGPRTGTKVKIRRASLGSYFASFNGQPSVRVRREN